MMSLNSITTTPIHPAVCFVFFATASPTVLYPPALPTFRKLESNASYYFVYVLFVNKKSK